MEAEKSEKRKEVRYMVEAGATVELNRNGKIACATTLNMSGSGVLLRFDEPVQLAVGDEVICDFKVSHEAERPLPYWGVGNVCRVEGCCVAIKLAAGCLSRGESEAKCPVAGPLA
jgi:hypothetical protein